MDFRKPDPNGRRRLDPEAQRNRDAEIAKMRRAGLPYRAIASASTCPWVSYSS
jgi:hypothetical protein